jgi:hypothetical protein
MGRPPSSLLPASFHSLTAEMIGEMQGYAVFFDAFTFAHRALCAAAIFLRAAGECPLAADRKIGTTLHSC